jgi:hypothetical protein
MLPYFAGTLLWVLLVSPILSPQYLVWIVPLLMGYVLLRLLREKVPGGNTLGLAVLLCVLTLGTQWIYPHHYGQFMNEQYPYLVVLLNLRNISLLALLLLLIFPGRPAHASA